MKRKRWFHYSALKIEMIFSVCIKLAILYVIWKLCFSHPIDKTLTPDLVGHHFISTSQTRGSL